MKILLGQLINSANSSDENLTKFNKSKLKKIQKNIKLCKGSKRYHNNANLKKQNHFSLNDFAKEDLF